MKGKREFQLSSMSFLLLFNNHLPDIPKMIQLADKQWHQVDAVDEDCG